MSKRRDAPLSQMIVRYENDKGALQRRLAEIHKMFPRVDEYHTMPPGRFNQLLDHKHVVREELHRVCDLLAALQLP